MKSLEFKREYSLLFLFLSLVFFITCFLFGCSKQTIQIDTTELKNAKNDSEFVEQMDLKFCEIEDNYIDDEGYVQSSKKDVVLHEIYSFATEIAKQKLVASVILEETNCVRIELLSGTVYIYEPETRGVNTGGGLNRVVSLQPYRSEQKLKTADEVAQQTVDCGVGFAFRKMDNLDNQNVTIEAAKSLKSSAVIIWDGHGGYTKEEHSFVGTTLNAKEIQSNKKYEKDLINKRIVIKHSRHLVFFEKPVVCLTASFFDYYYKPGDLEGALLFFTTCHSADDDYFANVFLKKGAEAVFANRNSIYTEYVNKMMESIFNDLTGFKTAGKALENAKKQYGKLDTEYFPNDDKGEAPAEVKLFGDNSKNYKLYKQNTNAKLSFKSVESEMINHANDFVGGNMPFRGYGKKIYYCDDPYKPSGVFCFNSVTSKCEKIVNLTAPKEGTVNIVEFYQQGFGVKVLNSSSAEYEGITLYDLSGNKVLSDSYSVEEKKMVDYDGNKIYFCDQEKGIVYVSEYKENANSRKTVFDLNNTEYEGSWFGSVFTFNNKSFVEVYYQEQWILISEVNGEIKEIANFGDGTSLYIHDNELFYIYNKSLLQKSLNDVEYSSKKICGLDENYAKLYFVCGERFYYGKSTDNGNTNIIYYKEGNAKPVKIHESSCPIGGI